MLGCILSLQGMMYCELEDYKFTWKLIDGVSTPPQRNECQIVSFLVHGVMEFLVKRSKDLMDLPCTRTGGHA